MKKKIKVLHVFKSYYPDTKGGVEKIIDELCILTKNYKIQSDIYTLSNARKVVKRKNYKIYFEKKTFELFSCPFSINSIFHFKDIVRGYDVIHYHFPWPFMDFLHLVLKIKKKFIVTYHSDIIKQKKLKFFYNYFKNKFLSKAYKIVFTSNNYKQTSELSQKLKKNSLVIPLGLNNRRSTSKRKFKKKIKSNYFIFIGQLRHYKGIDTIINCPDSDKYKIVILGSGEKENIIFENLKKKKKNIIFYKNKND